MDKHPIFVVRLQQGQLLRLIPHSTRDNYCIIINASSKDYIKSEL